MNENDNDDDDGYDDDDDDDNDNADDDDADNNIIFRLDDCMEYLNFRGLQYCLKPKAEDKIENRENQ